MVSRLLFKPFKREAFGSKKGEGMFVAPIVFSVQGTYSPRSVESVIL